MQSHMVRRLVFIVAVLGLIPTLPSCGEKKKKSEVKAEAAEDDLRIAMEMRRKRVVAAIPPTDDPANDEHPWLAFVKKAVQVTPANEIRKAAVHVTGTAIAEKAELLAAWLEAERDFFQDEKLETNAYWREVSGARRVSKGTPWEQDVEFDILFFHAAVLARTWDLFASDVHDDRVLRFFTYWKFVFMFESKTAIYEDECNTICATKFSEFCKNVPMEERPFQLMIKYYEGVIGQIEAYKKSFPASPYNAFLDRVALKYKEKITKVPKYEEYPLMPPIRSSQAAPLSGNAILSVTPRGISLMDNVLRKPDTPWTPDWAADAKLLEESSKLAEDVRSTTASAYNQSTIMLVSDPDVPVRYLEPLLRSTIIGEHAKEWTTVVLVGRRRGDGTNRRSGYQMSLLAKDKTVVFKLKAPGGKMLSCTAWANVGKDSFEAKAFAPVVFHDGKQVHAGKLAFDGTIGALQSAAGHGDGDRLQSWADGQTSSIVVAVPEGAPYKDLIEAMNGVALHCDTEECKNLRPQPVFVATCR